MSSKSYAPLGSRGVQKRLKDYLQAAGLRTSASPHTLRHSFATVAIEKGANIKAVSQIMGHSSCRITIDLYTHLSNEHLRAVMQRCNPLATEVIPIAERIETRKQHRAIRRPPDSPNRPAVARDNQNEKAKGCPPPVVQGGCSPLTEGGRSPTVVRGAAEPRGSRRG